jgi:glycerophosphoryl diester phosphodiesterase
MLLLGHRGARASRQVRENSLESFELCLQHGCDGFEFDVRHSADGVAVICHDPVIRGVEIARTPAAQLALPTLGDVLRQFSSRAFLDIELKVPGLELGTIEALRKHQPSKGYVVSSFLPEVLTAIHALDAAIPLGFLCDKRATLQSYRQLPVEWVIPQLPLVEETLIEELHSAKKKVMVWTVNRPNDIERLSHCGVDSIISDETEMLVRALRPNSSPQI